MKQGPHLKYRRTIPQVLHRSSTIGFTLFLLLQMQKLSTHESLTRVGVFTGELSMRFCNRVFSSRSSFILPIRSDRTCGWRMINDKWDNHRGTWVDDHDEDDYNYNDEHHQESFHNDTMNAVLLESNLKRRIESLCASPHILEKK